MAQKPDFSAGLSAGVKYWLFFMIGLYFLGYPPTLSICWGALGGIAGGWIEAYLNAKEDDTAPPKKSETALPSPAIEPLSQRRARRSGFKGMLTHHERRVARWRSLFRRQ